MESNQEILVSIYELAKAAGITPHAARQLIIAEVIKPHRKVKRGRNIQPLFLESELGKLIATIQKHSREMAA